jgi:hypothetical protein
MDFRPADFLHISVHLADWFWPQQIPCPACPSPCSSDTRAVHLEACSAVTSILPTLQSALERCHNLPSGTPWGLLALAWACGLCAGVFLCALCARFVSRHQRPADPWRPSGDCFFEVDKPRDARRAAAPAAALESASSSPLALVWTPSRRRVD